MDRDTEPPGVQGQNEHVHPAGFWTRCGWRRGGEWFSTSSYRRSAVAYHVDDGDGTGHSRECNGGPRGRVDRPGADVVLDSALQCALCGRASPAGGLVDHVRDDNDDWRF